MEAEFWIKAWNEGRTNFHLKNYHDKLVTYFPELSPRPGQKVLVPLCGKTKDLLWLEAQGLKVHGIELYEQPVQAFFIDNSLPPAKVNRDQDYTHYSSGNITISCGDFFRLYAPETYDFVYDRAALIALPESMRTVYAGVVKRSLKPGGRSLLITYEYGPSLLEGPPFSVTDAEVHQLFGDCFKIEQRESKPPTMEGGRLTPFGDKIKQNVYVMTKF